MATRAPLLAGRLVVGKPFAGDFEPPRKPQVQQAAYQTTSVAPDVSAFKNLTNRSYEDVDGATYKQESQYEQESHAKFEDKKNYESDVSSIALSPSVFSGTTLSSVSSAPKSIDATVKEFHRGLEGWSWENIRKDEIGLDLGSVHDSEPAAVVEELTAEIQSIPPAESLHEHHGEPLSQLYQNIELVLDAINEPNRSRSISFRSLRHPWNMWHRPRLRAGYQRLEWICDCGEELYGDFDNANPEAVNRLHHILQRPAHQSTGYPNQPQSISLDTPSANSLTQGTSNPAANALRNRSLQPIQSMIPTGCNMPPPPEPHTRKFVELCVNTGKFHKSLGEIDITRINCDRDLFALIKSRYNEIRGHRSKFFLEPTAVEWVQFSLEERHRVGILLRPNAVPPKAEVVSLHYEYAPCPLDALPPIPDNVFLHHFANPGLHRRPIWLRRLPKKVNESILGSSEELVTGWGVHIVEGPNWLAVWQVAFCIVFMSGLFGILWSVYRSDVSGAFGVASWMTSVLTLLMMVCFSKWSRE